MSITLAERISKVPKLYETGNKSTASLLKDMGFPDRHLTFSADEVEAALRREPRLTDLWLKRCSDQRIAGGWGIERENGEYRIRRFSDGKSVVVQDRIRACAEFVVRYVSFIGEVLTRVH